MVELLFSDFDFDDRADRPIDKAYHYWHEYYYDHTKKPEDQLSFEDWMKMEYNLDFSWADSDGVLKGNERDWFMFVMRW